LRSSVVPAPARGDQGFQTQDAHVTPAPKATRMMGLPGSILPASYSSSRQIGMLAALVLP
jgi:hypothetical protein